MTKPAVTRAFVWVDDRSTGKKDFPDVFVGLDNLVVNPERVFVEDERHQNRPSDEENHQDFETLLFSPAFSFPGFFPGIHVRFHIPSRLSMPLEPISNSWNFLLPLLYNAKY